MFLFIVTLPLPITSVCHHFCWVYKLCVNKITRSAHTNCCQRRHHAAEPWRAYTLQGHIISSWMAFSDAALIFPVMGNTLDSGSSMQFQHRVHDVFPWLGNASSKTRWLELTSCTNSPNIPIILTAQGHRSSLTWGPPITEEIRDSTSLPGVSGHNYTTRRRYTCNVSLMMNVAFVSMYVISILTATSESSFCYIGAVTRMKVLVNNDVNDGFLMLYMTLTSLTNNWQNVIETCVCQNSSTNKSEFIPCCSEQVMCANIKLSCLFLCLACILYSIVLRNDRVWLYDSLFDSEQNRLLVHQVCVIYLLGR